MRTSATSRRQSRKQKPESRNLAVESVEELRARGILVVTKAQMAAALQVTYRTITAMMRRGEISYFRIGDRLVRIRIEEALARMEKAEGGGLATDGHG